MSWTEEEIAAAFAAAITMDEGEGALSVEQLSERLGHGQDWVRRRLKLLLAQGAWECVPVLRTTMNQMLTTRMAYRPRK